MVVLAHKKKRKKIDPGEQVSDNGSIAKNPRKKSRKSEAQKLRELKAKAAREEQKRKQEEQKRRIWNIRKDQLVAFEQEFGHTQHVQQKKYTTNIQLGKWVNTQQSQYRLFKAEKTGNLTQERINQLDELKFEWSPRQNGNVCQNGKKNQYRKSPEQKLKETVRVLVLFVVVNVCP